MTVLARASLGLMLLFSCASCGAASPGEPGVPSAPVGPLGATAPSQRASATTSATGTPPPPPMTDPPPTTATPRARSDAAGVIEAVIAFPDFFRFGTTLEESGEQVFVLLRPNVPAGEPLAHPTKRVVVLSEAECLRDMITAFFEIRSLDIAGDVATVRYTYPDGAHFGTLTLGRTDGVWRVTDKHAMRSSSGRRRRLEKFYERIPSPRLPDSDVRPDDPARCRQGDVAACYRTAIARHNAGRLEEAEALYEQACRSGDVQACHNVAMLLVKTGRAPDGLRRLEQLCSTQKIPLSCAMAKKYGETGDGPRPPSRAGGAGFR